MSMSRPNQTTPNIDSVQRIASELSRLFDQQVELGKKEAFVGLTPTEREEYDRITEKIRESYARLAKLETDV
jgi:hypothetical protein